jgi:prevent-host-death family protein
VTYINQALAVLAGPQPQAHGLTNLSLTHFSHMAQHHQPPAGHCHQIRTSCIFRGIQELSIMSTDDVVTVTSADFQRNIGLYQDEALKKPVAITKNGRPRTVLISAEEYERLKRRDRRVITAGEVSERQIAALREARVPDRFADLDAELKNWKP